MNKIRVYSDSEIKILLSNPNITNINPALSKICLAGFSG